MCVLASLRPSLFCLFTALMIAALISPAALLAKEPPADICTLLPADQLQKVLNQAFELPEHKIASAAYHGQPTGTECDYVPRQAKPSALNKVVFIAYADPSAAQAKETYEKLSVWFAPKSKPPSVGDAAYIDEKHAIHVLKGRVRYYINIVSTEVVTSARDKQLIDLAVSVGEQL